MSHGILILSEASIAPFTGRPDRAVLVGDMRRRLLSSPLGPAYYATMTRLF